MINSMKLHLTAQSERGKEVTKSANDYLSIEIHNSNRNAIYSIEIENRDDEIALIVNNNITGEKEIFSVPQE